MARLLRLSLGCLNPNELPSLWLGKRWVKSRFQNSFRDNKLLPSRILQRRQGLNLGEAVQQYNMAWIPRNLAFWSARVPLFQVERYPNLDIGVNSLRATLQVSSSQLQGSKEDSQIREYLRLLLRDADTLDRAQESGSPEHIDVVWMILVLIEMCVQAYSTLR